MKTKNTLFILSLFILLTPFSFAQTPIGFDITGTFPNERFGYTVSISDDGRFVAIGAPTGLMGGLNGRFRVFEYQDPGPFWMQTGTDKVALDFSHEYGRSLDISEDGQLVIVGAPGAADPTERYAHLYRYSEDINDWGLVWSFLNDDTDRRYGWQVAGTDQLDVIAIGSPNLGDGSGTAEVWVNVSTTAVPNYQLAGSLLSGDANFGAAIDVASEDALRLAVATVKHNTPGKVNVYELVDDEWVQMGAEIPAELLQNANSEAISLSKNGTRLAIGMAGDEVFDFFPGKVVIYEWKNGSWIQMGNEISDNEISDKFGYSVSLSDDGTRVAIGVRDFKGKVVVYDWENGDWNPEGNEILGEPGPFQSNINFFIGSTVSLSGPGAHLAIGAPQTVNSMFSGRVRVYSLSPITSTDEPLKTIVDLFPNPTNGLLQVRGALPDRIQVFNAIGEKVISSNINRQEINLSGLASGFYFIHMEVKGQWIVRSVYKQ